MNIFLPVIIAGIALDQISKLIASAVLKGIGTYPVIDGVFHLTYAENTGAAFSLMSGRQMILILTALAITCGAAYILVRSLKRGMGRKMMAGGSVDPMWIINMSTSLVISGAIGNMIDRIRLGHVIDFFDFRLIDFAIFNVADCFVVVGTIVFSATMILANVDPFGETGGKA